MNKQLIVFLAVALISVHAFVKRDAPAAGEVNYVEKFQKDFESMKNTFEENLKKVVNPDEIKKNFNEFIDNVSKTLDGMKPKGDAPK